MIVMKFGGTSVGNADAISQVTTVVKHSLLRKPVVVVSAIAKITDALTRLAEESLMGAGSDRLQLIRSAHEHIIEDLGIDRHICANELRELEQLVSESLGVPLDAKRLDLFQSFGERMSARIIAAKLSKDGIPARAYNAWDVGMITDDHFGAAEPLASSCAVIREAIAKINEVPVITGFIGKTEAGEVTTLGRGGTDYTTAIIGAAIGAETIQIWKEVDGIMTTDPRIVPEARVVPELAFEEACELAYFGAKVLHPKTIVPAMKAHIPVEVRNTFKPELPGTTIVSTFAERTNKSATVEALTIKRRVTMLHISSPEFFEGSGLMARIFGALDKRRISVDVIATSVASVSLTIEHNDHLEEIAEELSGIGEVSIEANKAIICAVGGSVNAAGVVGQMFSILGDAGVAISVEMISQAAGGVSITFVVDEKDAEQAVKVLHKEYIEHQCQG
jgi:aspartate kinase